MKNGPVERGVLSRATTIAREYLQECYDNMPLHTHEQSLALAYAGLTPTDASAVVNSSNPKSQPAWILSTMLFLRMMYPEPRRKTGHLMYDFLDELELDDPGGWASTHNDVVAIIRDSGYEISEFRNL